MVPMNHTSSAVTALICLVIAVQPALGAKRSQIPAATTVSAAGRPRTAPAAWAGISRTRVAIDNAAGTAPIAFANGYQIDPRLGDPELPAGMKYTAPKDGEAAYYIVQFRGPIREEWRNGLEAEGAQVMFYLPQYAFVVRMNESIRARIAVTKGEIGWIGLYHPAYKISDRALSRAKGGMFRATVLLFTPEKMDDAIRQVEAITGRKIWMKLETEWAPGQWNRKVFVDLAAQDLEAIARLPGVCWIEPMGRHEIMNSRSSYCVQHGVADSARMIWRHGVTGQGQVIQNLDTGCRESSNFFVDNLHRHAYVNGTSEWYWDAGHRKVVAQQPAGRYAEVQLGWNAGTMSRYGDANDASPSYHGTHTTGSNCGKDTAGSNSAYNGMARDARLLFLDGGGDSGSVFGTSDLNIVGSWGWDSLYAHLGLRACISSNSWGDSSAHGRYDASAMEADQFMWSHKDYLFFFAAGNEQTEITPPNIGSPATNKNGVCVGALNVAGATSGGANAMANYSCRMKMADGRIGNTVVAPGGTGSTSTTGITSADGNSDAGTRIMMGTSMATPITAGACALARQYYADGWYPSGAAVAADGFTPSAALLKATMAISGDSVTATTTGRRAGGFVISDSFGFGRVNLDTALFFTGDNQRLILDDNRTGVVTGERVEYLVNIPASAQELRICLAWTDYPGAVMSSPTLVNNLDLDAYEPGGSSRYRGNRYTSNVNPMQSIADPANSDTLNVIEGVKRVSPTAGLWRVTVTGANVASGPQPFALVVTYRTSAAAMGKVKLDKASYSVPSAGGVGDTVRITVDDANRTTAACVVRVYAKLNEADPETVACTKVGNGLYTGKIALWFGNITHGDGRLTVDQGDSITALFTDNDPAFTDTARAAIDGSLFRISNVRAEDLVPPNGTQKDIKWATSENATQKVYYGLTTALGLTVQADTPLTLDHSLRLSGLTANTVYYYDVESRDYRGNTVRDNNAGRHYQFGTGSGGGAKDVLVCVLDDGGFANAFIHGDFLTKALDAGGWSYDWWSTQLQGDITTVKLKQYKAVFFQVTQNGPSGGGYPAFTPAQRETIKLYHDAGARFAFTGNDYGWDVWGNTETHPAGSAILGADTTFCRNYLHFTYKGDITATTWTTARGISGDPISGSYSASPWVPYAAWRSGAAGDSILLSGSGLAGTGSYVWHGAATADSCAIKWQSTANLGSLGNGVWGGYPTRVVTNAFEITQLDTTNKNSTTRTDILNKMFIWLIGHDHPYDTIQTPVAGTTYSTSPISISWRSYAKGGATIDTTWVEYSNNNGSSWNLLTSGNGVSSPYSWNIGALENGSQYQVRVRVKDGGVYPAMTGFDTVGNFTINKGLAGDFTGPIVLPGSAKLARNPVGNTTGNDQLMVEAVASDSTCGLSPVYAAKCSIRVGGSSYTYAMSAADGSFSSVQEIVRDTIATTGWPQGTYKLYLMAADNSAKALRWGVKDSVYVVVSNLGALAVSLSQMNAAATARGVVIDWRTESETNSRTWLIERSESGAGPFAQIASLDAAGSSSQPHSYTYTDAGVQNGTVYYYRLVEVSQSGDRSEFGPLEVRAIGVLPAAFDLAAPRPNPFRNRLAIRYQLPQASAVSLAVYNITGQKVRTLQEGNQDAGYYSVDWDGRNQSGKAMASGVYFYKLHARSAGSGETFSAIKKATLLR